MGILTVALEGGHHVPDLGFRGGAGDGNRTRMTSLEDRCAQWSVTSENIAAGRWRAHARE
jgi:hypothetical protein